MVASRPARVLTLTATGVFVVAGIYEFVWLWGYIDSQNAIGADLVFFRSIAEHWLDTGQFYLEHQLTGPYVVQTQVDVLYPPTALLLFVPFVWLPSLLWWLLPVGIFVLAIRQLRPARWTWPLIAAGIAYPADGLAGHLRQHEHVGGCRDRRRRQVGLAGRPGAAQAIARTVRARRGGNQGLVGRARHPGLGLGAVRNDVGGST